MTPTQFVIFTIERLKARLRTNDLLTGLLGLLALVLAWLVAVVVVDQAVALPRGIRLVLVVLLGIIAALALVVVLAWPTIRKLNNLYVARLIEAHDEHRFRNSLTTFVEFHADPEASDDVRRAVAEKAARDLTELDVEVLVCRRPLRRMVVVLATAGSILLAFGLLAPKGFSASLARAIGAEVEAPTATRIAQLRPADGFRVVAGYAVTIELQLSGSLPDEVSIDLRHADGHQQRKPMRRISDNTWEFAVADLLEDLRFSVLAGDARSAQHRLIVYPLPHVTDVVCRLTHPAYTRRAPQNISGGNISALPGTQVEVTVLTSHPPEAPELRFDDGRKVILRPLADGSGARGEFVLGPTAVGYHIAFRDKQLQLENRNPVEYRISPLEDRPPLVELAPPGPLDVPVNAPVTLHVRAVDDHGLAGCWIDLYALPADDPELAAALAAGELSPTMLELLLGRTPLRSVALLPDPVPPEPQPLATSIDLPVKLTPAAFDIRPGDALLARARATDLAPGRAGLAGVSNAVLVRVLEAAGEQETASSEGSAEGANEAGDGQVARSTDDAGDSGESANRAETGADQTSTGQRGGGDETAAGSTENTGDATASTVSADAGSDEGGRGAADVSTGEGASSGEVAGAQSPPDGTAGAGQGNPLNDLSTEERQKLDSLMAALAKLDSRAASGGNEPTAEPASSGSSGNGGAQGADVEGAGSEGTSSAADTAGQSDGASTDAAGSGSPEATADDSPRERPEQMDESGRGGDNSAESPQLAAVGPRIMRLANDLRRGEPVDSALLKELGWSEADLRQVVSNYSERFDAYAGQLQQGPLPVRGGPSDSRPGRVAEGHGPLGTGGAEHQPAQPGAGGTVVRPPERPVSPEYAEIIEAYLRAVNQVE